MKGKRIILVTNDDGIKAKGLNVLADVAKSFGEVRIVAPLDSQSAMSHAITVKNPIRVFKETSFNGIEAYACNGTPVDCVKMAVHHLLPTKPSLILSGINHGSNSSSSILYSGTVAAAIEGCLNGIPSIGFSLLEFSNNANFEAAKVIVYKIIKEAIENGIPNGICLNVNIPYVPLDEIKGIKICRQNHGVWREEFEHRTDPNGFDYYWLTGTFENLEPHAEDTDEWALKNNYVSIVPIHYDFTSYKHIEEIKKWSLNGQFN